MKDETIAVPNPSFILHPSAFILPLCGVAKLVRHRTVNAAMRRFESFRHSQCVQRMKDEGGRMKAGSAGSSKFILHPSAFILAY